ncbi:protease [Ancylomarina euxinus]|uniref:Tricorn protease homolog n=1 Tax=Ancylomarina euxinus TaxID=2283627 RepID=A0A425Y3Y0_9BACT|nr:S41 family peptidase [Ancylomarina euxinus]MCZ4694597.1 PDZ domain-containing protein [Ancylomarina euxinus]MUP14140.1 protease [Ancylomarina euxinus]RRG22995.1 protease [Ancylomarina euxinus]
MTNNYLKKLSLFLVCFILLSAYVQAQGTRLLRQPTLSETHIAYTYAGDLWVSDLNGTHTLRLTSTPAVESDPYFSPDGQTIAFTSNRSGVDAVYTVPVTGGEVKQLTWYPAASNVRGWTPDGKRVLYASTRETAPSNYDRLWTVSREGGVSTMLNAQWGTKASFAADGKQIVIDKVRRWDREWRAYRGGQNTPLIILNLEDSSEKLLPNESTIDVQPVWIGDKIYFLSDRDWAMNIWMYDTQSNDLKQITKFKDIDIKSLSGNKEKLVFEREGYLHTYDLVSGKITQLELELSGDFPWARTKWEDVSSSVRSASLSPTGKRAIMSARGEVFTVPVEHGDARNITNNSAAADRAPIWSPKGDKIAWFSDINGKGYQLMLANQDGLSEPEAISIKESKMAWEPAWSPDGKYIVFTDDDVRIRLIDIEAKSIKTIDVGGNNFERGDLGLSWSKDSKWLAYAKSGANNFRRVCVWSMADDRVRPITNELADAFSPAWDADTHHLYFLASTDLALLSGYVNTSVMGAKAPNYEAYVVNLLKKDASPFEPRSDEEKAPKKEDKKDAKDKKKDDKEKKAKEKADSLMQIDFDGIERRIIPLPMEKGKYRYMIAGPKGIVFIAEANPKGKGSILHKFDLKEREAKEFASGVGSVSISADGNQMLAKMGASWKVIGTKGANTKSAKVLKINLKTQLDRMAEWNQMFEEAWRYQRDYFYDPNMHGRDWDEVYKRYTPLVPYIKHRSDLNYVLDQVNGELSVGHSFVFGGDFPKTDRPSVGLLGADLKADGKHWKIQRIYTSESWNPDLSSPLDRPGMKVEQGNYIVGINGKEISNKQDPYMALDGTAGQQTVLHINNKSDFKGAWKITVKPISSERALRQRAWVEDNRRLVDKLSGGRLAYIWVPNTSNNGFISFNRYYFAQQDKEGAVIDERFNGGGLLDDYMVDLMKRETRACLTNEVPNGDPIRLPAGIVGPKVLIINELAGSGGDFFPWVFKHQKIGPVVGARTWGGLVKSSIHYRLVDGGALTAPDNAVFDPNKNEWVGENKGISPTIDVRQDAKSLNKGIDPQLERAVKEVLSLLPKTKRKITPPPFSTPALRK